MTYKQKRKRSQSSSTVARRGAATVEMAVCLPLLFLLVFGSIEISNVIHVKHSATIAAFEVAQSVTSPGGTQNDATARGSKLLTDRKVMGYQITVTPVVNATTFPGTPITVTVQVPLNSNSLGITTLLSGQTISSVVTMEKL
jgi:Flp pilus assembly protein TadG